VSAQGAQAVNAKCRAMYARLLSRADYDTLLGYRSVQQVADYLKKETPYSYVLRKLDSNDVHRGQLEQVFKSSLYYDYERLLLFCSGEYKDALQAMFSCHEVEDLRLIVGALCSRGHGTVSARDVTYIRHYSSLPMDALLGAENMEQFVAALAGSRYHAVLAPFASREGADFLAADHALDMLNYKTKLAAFKTRLTGSGRKLALGMLGEEADLENLLFIYRAKKLYRFEARDILPNLVPGRHVGAKELFEMADCGGTEELARLIARTRYRPLFPEGREEEWEALRNEKLYEAQRRNLREHGNDVGVAFSYLFLKEVDIRNIVRVVEGVRYQLPASQIAGLLIGYRQLKR